MADIINAPDLPSEDEDDTDYDPSRDADKGDETRAKPKLGLKGRNKRLAGDTGEQSDGEEGDVALEPKFSKAAAKRAKVEALWENMSGGGGKQKQGLGDSGSTAVGEPQGSKPAAGINWGSLCRPIRRAAAPEDKNRNWMLQLGLTGKKGGPGDKTTCLSQEHSSCTPKQEPQGSGAANGVQIAGGVEAKASPDDHSQEKPQSTAAAALAAAKAAVSSAGHGQVAVTETRRFAGKDIQVTKQVAAADAAAQAEADAAKRNKAGLDSVLASLQAAKKVNVLDKSRSDWRDFKTSDAKVDDELEAYKKSNDKYLDKVDFLKRAELREYEKERDARLGGDIRSRGRL